METLAQKLARLKRAMERTEPSLYYDVKSKGFETFMGLPAKKQKPAPAPKRQIECDILDF